MVPKPVARDKNRQFVFVSEAQSDFEKVFAIFIEPVLVGVEVRGTNAHGISAVNLRAKLQLDFCRIDFCRSRPVVMKIAIFIDQAWNSGF